MVKSTTDMKLVGVFLADVVTELKKISWPSRSETARMTTIVIIVTVLTGLFVGTVDFGLTKILAVALS